MKSQAHPPQQLSCALALVATACLTLLPSCEPQQDGGVEADISAEQEAALRKIVQEEMAKVLSTTRATDAGQMRQQIDTLILEEIRKQLSSHDWDKEFNSEPKQPALESARPDV